MTVSAKQAAYNRETWQDDAVTNYPPAKARGRRTLPPWPEPVNLPQPDPVRFILAEPEAKSQLIKLLATGCICTLLGISWGLGFAAWLQTPQPWTLLSRLAHWWFGL